MKIFCIGATGLLGIIVTIGATLGLIFFRGFVENQVKKQIPLINGSETMERWENVDVPIYMKFHLFNIKNGDQVLNGLRPEVEERGPYVFRETRKKDVLSIENDLITYTETKAYYFEPELSKNLTLDDIITTVNIPAISVLSLLKYKLGLPTFSPFVEFALKNSSDSVIIKTKVGDILFNGNPIKFWPTFLERIRIIKPDIDNPFPDNTFCLMDKQNNTDSGLWTVNSGISELSDYTFVKEWNNESVTHYWNNSTCDIIHGTDGSQFPPGVTKDRTLPIFNTDLCRSISMSYEQETEIRNIGALRYTVPKSFYLAPGKSTENACYCVKPEEQSYRCNIDGILDISNCKEGAPILISAPHFYQGDRSLIHDIGGMKPNKKRHETFLDVEPMTGLVINAARRIQINVQVEKNDIVEDLQKLNDTVMPILWLEESASIDEKSANDFKSKVQSKIKLGMSVLIAALVIGIGLLVASVGLFAYHKRSHFV